MNTHNPTLTINLHNLQQNWQILQDHAPTAECAAMVKADGYGLGVLELIQALHQQGCRTFYVATLEEAIQIREKLPQAFVYATTGPQTKEECEIFHTHNIAPVLNTLKEIELWKNHTSSHYEPARAGLHIDTGMHRYGLNLDQHKELINQGIFDSLHLTKIISHMASSEEDQNSYNEEQLQKFNEIAAFHPDQLKSFSNTSGIFLGPDFHFNEVRAGYGLYGGNPTPNKTNPLHTVAELTAPIIQISTVKQGRTIGYNQTFKTQEESRIATLRIGYADGLHRSLSNTGVVKIGDYTAPIVGRISMDLTTVDVSNIPPNELENLSHASIYASGDISIDEQAKRAGTNGYELLTSLGARIERNFINKPSF